MAAISNPERPRARRGNLVLYIFLTALTLLIGFPLIALALQSLLPSNQLLSSPPLLISPQSSLEHYRTLFAREDLMLVRWMLNSLYVTTITTFLVIAIASPAAYSFARLRYPGRNALFFLLLITIMVPAQLTYIPNFLLMRDLKFLDTYNALIFPNIANVFAVFLLRQFFQSIPRELEEAALLDGATYFGIFLRIIMPLSTTALVALGIFVFIANWNELVWALIVTSQSEMRTLPVGLTFLSGAYAGTNRGLVLAGAMFATIPVLIIYIIFQRWIIKGITFTGMGGR